MKKVAYLSFLVLLYSPFIFARNVILFVGDGMGPTYITATRLYLKKENKKLFMDSLPNTALVKTESLDSVVTDSAAAATAFGCGVKARNGVLCEDETAVPDKVEGKPLTSIAKLAKQKGMSVGILTTTRITHATPAAFYATVNSRDAEGKIAEQLLETDFDVFLGGGLKYFGPEKIQKLEEKGYTVVKTKATFDKIDPQKTTKLFGLFNNSHLNYELDRVRNNIEEPSLTELTLKAVQILKKNPKGFFLMVEGGRIDNAGHENDALRAITDTIAMDNALEALVKQLKTKETLVLVTADHETGGLSINGYPDLDVDLFERVREMEQVFEYPILTWSTGPGFGSKPNAKGFYLDKQPAQFKLDYAAHSGVDVYLYGWGSGSPKVRGTLDNTDIFKLMKQAL